MKYTSVTWLVLGLFAAGFSACATSERPEFGNQPSGGGEGGEGGDFGTGGAGGEGGAGGAGSTASSSSSSTGGEPVCATQCAADADCQNTCPAAPQGGANCCDAPTKSCYIFGASSCPTGQGGSGGTPMY
ncbi:hypothetical protein [Polyangium sp. 6x1]|uniref:hypothetical protein n=1 Tax=Polyangium sp. 6x1 TaxID=3042689 RepID=UPI002482161A|nr:hypothetical protein [Polyangium sp. 6x1]MDI1447647.1 hypothetical protein [Polyangium sp. 6x1]